MDLVKWVTRTDAGSMAGTPWAVRAFFVCAFVVLTVYVALRRKR